MATMDVRRGPIGSNGGGWDTRCKSGDNKDSTDEKSCKH